MSTTIERPEKSIERSIKPIYPYPGINYTERDSIYKPASHLMPMAEINLMRGKRDHSFTQFPHSEYSIVVPYRGIGTEEDSKVELNELEPQTIQHEPMQEFYRHVYMLHRFGDVDQLAVNIPMIFNRVKNESADFARKAYPDDDPDDEKLRKRTEEDFYFLKLACLEKLHEHGLRISQELVEELYEEAITAHPRSIHYAMMFENTDTSDPDYVPIAKRVKDALSSKLKDPETMDNQSIALLKWSFSDIHLQVELLRETLQQTEDKEQIGAAMEIFTQAMEVYDITTSLQEYAFTHEAFQPKVEMVLDYLSTHPAESDVRLNQHRKETELPRIPLLGDIAHAKFHVEEKISASSEVRQLEHADAIEERLADTYRERGPESIAKELEELTSQKLEHELFQDFYRHMDMLSKFGDAAIVAKFLPTIMRRGRIGVYPKYTNLPQNEFSSLRAGLPDELKKRAYLKMMACMEVCEEDPTVRLPLAAVKDLEDAAVDINPRFMRYALVFDERNKPYGESNAFMEKTIIDTCTSYLTDSSGIQTHHRAYAEMMLPWLYVRPELYSQILINSLNTIYSGSDADRAIRVVQGIAPFMGVEGVRKTLREHVSSLTEGYRIKQYEEITKVIFDYMQLDLNGPVAVDLVKDVYDRVNLEGYKPNDQLLKADIAVVEKHASGAENIADIACGTGRHLLALDGRNGKHVTGYDLVPKHIEHIKENNSDADVHQASWYELPAKDGQFDAAIMLGRAFAHNTTISDAVACLEEMKRVVKDDGSILLDLPNGRRGDYRDLIAQTIRKARAQGIGQVLPGTIIDSPDNTHYFDRYIPDEEAFTALCELAGLCAEKVDAVSYKGDGGEDNENIYWKLTKKPVHNITSIDRVAALVEIIRSDRYT